MTSVHSFAIGEIVVRAVSPRRTRGLVEWGGVRAPGALGRAGTRFSKRDGDGATPRGRFVLQRVLYRADREPRPHTALPVKAIARHDGWCDAPADRNYNRPVDLPYPASAERMWRDDGLYDIVVVLDHNARPRIRGAGSAIFIHLARPGYLPTEGCIALDQRHLLALLARARRGAVIRIGV